MTSTATSQAYSIYGTVIGEFPGCLSQMARCTSAGVTYFLRRARMPGAFGGEQLLFRWNAKFTTQFNDLQKITAISAKRYLRLRIRRAALGFRALLQAILPKERTVHRHPDPLTSSSTTPRPLTGTRR